MVFLKVSVSSMISDPSHYFMDERLGAAASSLTFSICSMSESLSASDPMGVLFSGSSVDMVATERVRHLFVV